MKLHFVCRLRPARRECLSRSLIALPQTGAIKGLPSGSTRYMVQIALYLLFFIGIPLPLLAAQDIAGASSNLSDLAITAHERGEVQVIVELATPYRQEGEFRTRASVQAQRMSIARSQEAVLDQVGDATLTAAWKTIPFMAMAVDADGLASLQKSSQVLSIQEDRRSDPLLASSTVHIGAPKAWAAGYDGSGQMVVVIDTGIQATHPFFGGRVVEEACFSHSDAPSGIVSLCPSGQITQTGTGAASALTAVCINAQNGRNLCSHGTHVAGDASGANPGDINYSGVAKDSQMAAIQVFTRFNDAADCGSTVPCISSYMSDEISALEYVYTDLRPNYAIAAVNMSLGGFHYTDQTQCDLDNAGRKAIIDNLRLAGIPTVIAAGNSYQRNSIAEPACISSAVAVSAVFDPSDTVAFFASISSLVELLAPGQDIGSAWPTDGYIRGRGTSYAAPHVAGAWAVLKQAIEAIEPLPDVSVDRILALLQSTGVPIDDTRSGGIVTDMPRIDLCAALTELGVTGSVELNVKVLLQGAFRDVDAGTGFIGGATMRDTLRVLEAADGFQGIYLPHSDPYAAQFGMSQRETISDTATVLADHGNNSIVDWIYLEVRDATSPATVLATRAALLQRDGDVVDMDGVSPVAFDCTLPGDYYVAVRHRDHLGVMTAISTTLAASGTLIDFSDPATDLWHSDAAYDGHEQAALNGKAMLWAGNANRDATIIYDGAASDSDAVNVAVLGATDNNLGSLGYIYAGYYAQDVEMNGEVIADGAGNEHGVILYNVRNHPVNALNALDFVVEEQLAVPGP